MGGEPAEGMNFRLNGNFIPTDAKSPGTVYQRPARRAAGLKTDDDDVDGNDFLTFSLCFNGSLNPPNCP